MKHQLNVTLFQLHWHQQFRHQLRQYLPGLSLVLGNFGSRWAKIAQSRGAIVEKIEVGTGEVIDPEVLRARLAQDTEKKIKIVTLTQSETSTGAANDVKTLCQIIREHGALSVVDGVTSALIVFVSPFCIVRDDFDKVKTNSQKIEKLLKELF